MQDEDEEDVEVLEHVSGVITAVLKNFGDEGMVVVDQLMPQLGSLMAPGASPQETRVCICIIDDILEYSPAGESHPIFRYCRSLVLKQALQCSDGIDGRIIAYLLWPSVTVRRILHDGNGSQKHPFAQNYYVCCTCPRSRSPWTFGNYCKGLKIGQKLWHVYPTLQHL